MSGELLIVGAGCAGLSLAVHLVERGVRAPIHLVDPREAFGSDRTWCFFRVRANPFDECIQHRWPRWQVRAGRTVERGCRAHPYVHVPSEAFYARALYVLESAPNVSLHLGVRAQTWRRTSDGVELQTSAGVLRGRWGFDSRPSPRPDPGGLVQHFRGFFVRTAEPVFDPGVVRLMDFDLPQGRGLRFAYVLPLAADLALIEDTYFTPEPFPIDDEILARVLGGEPHERLREERGAIPMSALPPPPPPERVVRIGLAAGVAKPSTGYAFEWIQRHAARIAEALRRDEPPPAFRRSTWMDAIFIDVIRRDPALAPALFLRLFERNPPARVARFLTETGTRRDALGVMASLPPAPFLRAALGRGARVSRTSP